MFIAPERKMTSCPGGGIQYIPGHDDPFVDYVIKTYAQDAKKILDLGGGGLRFAVPVALLGKKVLVVDIDKEGLDLALINEQIKANGKTKLPLGEIISNLTTKNQDIFTYLAQTTEKYDLITAFRLIHFFSPIQIDLFFELIRQKLIRGGILGFSAITPFNLKNNDHLLNEFYENSEALKPDYPWYRQFLPAIKSLQQEQNLSSLMHYIDEKFIETKATKWGFEILNSAYPSTRIVEGYILRKI